jgi:hypothetical protein
VKIEIPGNGRCKYESDKALIVPNRKAARTTFDGSSRLSIDAIVQMTSSEGATAAAPRADGKAERMSWVINSIKGPIDENQ